MRLVKILVALPMLLLFGILKLLIRALIAYKRKLENKQRLKQVAKNTHTKGKQSVKELIGQDQGVSSMEIGDSGIRDFKKLANKYGVDFAIVKDNNETPPKYTMMLIHGMQQQSAIF